jgi:hypothetical protein
MGKSKTSAIHSPPTLDRREQVLRVLVLYAAFAFTGALLALALGVTVSLVEADFLGSGIYDTRLRIRSNLYFLSRGDSIDPWGGHLPFMSALAAGGAFAGFLILASAQALSNSLRRRAQS